MGPLEQATPSHAMTAVGQSEPTRKHCGTQCAATFRRWGSSLFGTRSQHVPTPWRYWTPFSLLIERSANQFREDTIPSLGTTISAMIERPGKTSSETTSIAFLPAMALHTNSK